MQPARVSLPTWLLPTWFPFSRYYILLQHSAAQCNIPCPTILQVNTKPYHTTTQSNIARQNPIQDTKKSCHAMSGQVMPFHVMLHHSTARSTKRTTHSRQHTSHSTKHAAHRPPRTAHSVTWYKPAYHKGASSHSQNPEFRGKARATCSFHGVDFPQGLCRRVKGELRQCV